MDKTIERILRDRIWEQDQEIEYCRTEIKRLREALRHYACDCEQGGMPRGCNGGEKLDPECGWTAYIALGEEK